MPQAGGSPGNPPPPGTERLWWGGSGQAPLAALLGVGAQALWLAGQVLGDWGPPPAQGPTRAPLEPHQHMTRGWPTGLYSAGTSPEPMEPETSDHRGQNPYPHKGLPGPHELSPAQPAPPRRPENRYSQCPVEGASFLWRLPPAVGEAGGEGGSAHKLPGPQTSFSGVGVGEGGGGGRFSGGSGGSRKAGGHGEALAWATGLAGSAIRGVS